MVSETELNARFGVLTEQRNNALNQVVLLSAELAVARERIQTLEQSLASQPELQGIEPT